jgi:glycosyltransferase involved in cell wall biosynthesis
MVEESKIIVIPNGVDIENWRADVGVREMVRQESGFGNEFLWFAAGRLEKVKDYPTMLRAMAGLPETSSLVIAGAGHEEGTLRRICSELGLEQRVRFLGFESNVLRWMQAADGFVLSSRWEGLPMALLEAAACALPAVATEVPGSREVVLHGETGFLAAPGSSFALQEAMARTMLMQAEGRRAMGEQARSNAVKCFSLEMMLDRWEELYTSLLDRNPVPMRWGALKL